MTEIMDGILVVQRTRKPSGLHCEAPQAARAKFLHAGPKYPLSLQFLARKRKGADWVQIMSIQAE
jgi:hypothetical protein